MMKQLVEKTGRDSAVAQEVLPGDLMTSRQRARLVLVLGSLIAIGPLTIDMYLPALPAITTTCRPPSAAVQLTLTGTLVGLALGQLLIGPLSDAVGRRRRCWPAWSLHVLAPLLCVVRAERSRCSAPCGCCRAWASPRLGGRDGDGARPVQRRRLRPDLLPADAGHGRRADPGADAGQRGAAAGPTGAASSWRSPCSASLLIVVAALPACRRRCRAHRRRRGGVAGTVRGLPRRCCATGPSSGLVLVAGLAMAALFAYVSGSVVRLPGAVRPRRAAVRARLRGRRGRPDRRHPVQRPAAAPLHPAADPGRAADRRHRRPGCCWSCSPPPASAAWPACSSRSGWCWPRPGSPCRTRPRWRCPGTARRPAPPRRCSARSSSASARWRRRWSGCSAPAACAMAVVIAGGMAAALTVMLLVVPRASLGTVDRDLAVALH